MKLAPSWMSSKGCAGEYTRQHDGAFQLHPAERTCLSIARRRGWGFLSDDRAARQQALTWKIPLSGTIGVLLLAIRDRRLTIERGNVLLHEMVVRANYRTPTMDLGEILRLSDQPSAT